jgi:hypothetical protein
VGVGLADDEGVELGVSVDELDRLVDDAIDAIDELLLTTGHATGSVARTAQPTS